MHSTEAAGAAESPQAVRTSSVLLLEKAISEGVVADFSSNDDAQNQVSSSITWGADRTLLGKDVARFLLTAPRPGLNHPERLVIKGARIEGHLDVGCGTLRPFMFQDCRFDLPPNLNDSIASFVGFTGCAMPGLNAARLTCSGPVWLQNSQFSQQVDFENATMGGLSAGSIVTDSKAGSSFNMDGSRVGHDVRFLQSAFFGGLSMSGAIIGGELRLDRAKVERPSALGLAIASKEIKVRGSVSLERFEAHGSVAFPGSNIGGSLVAIGAEFHNTGKEHALLLDHAVFGVSVMAQNSRTTGGISLHHP